MTRQRSTVLAGVAAAVVLLAALARPLLHASGGRRSAPVASIASPALPGAVRAGVEAARAALACRLGNRLARACGELAVTGAGGYRAAAGQVVVLLAGTLHIRAGGAIPIAIRVVLVPAGGGWHGEVTLP